MIWPVYSPLYLNCFLAKVFIGKSTKPFLFYVTCWQHLTFPVVVTSYL